MWSDLRFAFRALRATPAFTVVALVVLTLGIGATTAIFSVVDGVVLCGLPFDRADRLVIVDESNPTGKGLPGGYVAAANFYDWRAQQRVFEDMAAFQGKGGFTVRDGGEPEDLRATMVSASLFGLLRVSPALGHAFTAQNEVKGNHQVAVISDGLWRRRFSADPNIVGKTMAFESGVWQILGVMPAGFTFPVGAAKPRDMWIPYMPGEGEMPRGDGSSRNYNAQVVARLKSGVSIEQARAQMDQIVGALKQQYPKWFRDRWVGVTPMRESIIGAKTRSWMLMLLGAVAFVLLIACVNVANLLLARATARSRDVGIRAAMGATRWQLARGLLVESLLLSCLGTLSGVVVALWGVDVLRASLPATLPRLSEVGVNVRVLAAAATAALSTGVLFGVLPAWQFSRPNLATTLREGGRSGTAGLARQRVRTILLVAEVALAVMLLVGAGLFVSSFVRLMSIDVGLDYKNVVTIGVYPKIDFAKEKIDGDMARAGVVLTEILDRARRLPGVDAAAITSGSVPLSQGWSRTSVTVPGKPKSDDPDDSADIKTISPDYFKVVKVPVQIGRSFTAADSQAGAPPVVMLNDIAVKRYFDGKNPIGTIVDVNGKREVVGVVRGVRLQGPESDLRPEVYVPFNPKRAFGATLMLRSSRNLTGVATDARAAIHAVSPEMVIPDPQTFESLFEKLIQQRRFNMLVLALFGVLAVVIAAVGIYGVMAYIVEQRTQEIGVRMALGAEPGQVLRMVLSRAVLFMATGLAIGLAGGWLLSRLVQAFLFKVEAHDPAVYAAAAGALLLAGTVAALVPARRASKVDPITALR